mmetsp:Transcript_76766/g.115508  ORF Transcript_76766/g.115508 Transcript_76766/m.115508 type:complete len:372 (+) Transcript_76766:174-1289(+)
MTDPSLPSLPVAKLDGHDGPVQVVRFTNDGKYCLTGGHDRTVRLWNPFRVDPAFTTVGADSMLSSSFVAPGRETNSNPPPQEQEQLPPCLLIQNYSSGHTHPISAVAATESATGQQLLLAASEKTLVVSDLVANRVLRRLQGHHVARINAVAASDRGDVFLTASYDGTVALWDGRSRDYKPMQVFKEAKDSVTDVHTVQKTIGDGGKTALIRTASVDGCVRSYDLRSGLINCDHFGSPITSMAPTHDGQCLVVACLDGTIRLVEVESGELMNTYHGSHQSGRYSLEVSILASDATIATGSEDGACVLYDLVRANCVQKLEGITTAPTCSLSTHPKKASVLVNASYDGSTTIWSNDAAPWLNQLVVEDVGVD